MLRTRHPRAKVDIPVSIYEPSSQQKIGTGQIFNISIGGVALKTSTIIGVESNLLLEFKLKKYKHIDWSVSVKGKVEIKWKQCEGNDYQYGVKFSSLTSMEKFQIRKFVDYLVNKKKYII